jgi:hypothetical protein
MPKRKSTSSAPVTYFVAQIHLNRVGKVKLFTSPHAVAYEAHPSTFPCGVSGWECDGKITIATRWGYAAHNAAQPATYPTEQILAAVLAAKEHHTHTV